jgi:2,3,4,5-tetrahydropyridine-2-carboxylate N-succinyltransferase
MPLREQIETISARPNSDFSADDRAVFEEFKRALNRGEIRAAEKTESGIWKVNSWVKQGILLGFRMGKLVDQSAASGLNFFDKDTYPLRPTQIQENIRIVPGGSSIRDGVYIAPGVVCMPPMYVNAGAYVDEGTMI